MSAPEDHFDVKFSDDSLDTSRPKPLRSSSYGVNSGQHDSNIFIVFMISLFLLFFGYQMGSNHIMGQMLKSVCAK